MQSEKPVVILGAGLAGLTAATYLRRHGVNVRVFEASKNIAGLSRSELDPDGFTYDCGAHFINSRLAASLGISARCVPLPTYEEAVWFRGQRYTYPMGLLASPRYISSAVLGKLRGLTAPPGKNLAEHFRLTVGSAMSDEIALPLVAAWSGKQGEELSPAVAEKFSTGLLRTLWLHFAGWASGKTVSSGYSQEVCESPHVYFVYPVGGIGAACEKLADEVRDAIQTESPVQSIEVEDDRVVGVTAKGEHYAASAVISTAPLPILAKLVHGTDCLSKLAEFTYRPMVFVNLKFEGGRAMRDVVTWTPEDRYPFFRTSDIGRALPWLVPEGKSLLTCDIGCQVGDNIWNSGEDLLAQRCLEGLDDIVPGLSKRFVGARLVRTPFAYPVYSLQYEALRRKMDFGTGVPGLWSVGRNGEFKHILMEDVYWRTRKKCCELLSYLNR
jgi:protoporphyrinogen oxidase